MLIARSCIHIKDNSGIVIAQCIQEQRSKKTQKPCTIGDFFKGAIKKGGSKTQGPKQKSQNGSESLRDFIVIQTKKSLRRLDGSSIRFNNNCAWPC